jgi:hypothetical protein
LWFLLSRSSPILRRERWRIWKEVRSFENFFVVSLGILAALVGFLIAFPLVVSGVFTEPTQVIALLSGLFGTIVGLVGTYFGVKSSGDTSQRAQELARAMTGTLPETTPMGPGLPWKRSHSKRRRRREVPKTESPEVGARVRCMAIFLPWARSSHSSPEWMPKTRRGRSSYTGLLLPSWILRSAGPPRPQHEWVP